MLKIILSRLATSIPTVLIVLTLIFVLVRVVPGDPMTSMLGDQATPQVAEAMRAQLGLNRPLIVQYWDFMSGIVVGDFGVSMMTKQPVSEIIAAALPHTIDLTIAALLVGVVLGVPAGVYMATYRNGFIDAIGRFLTLLGLSFPVFVWAIIFLFAFSINWRIFNVIGTPDIESYSSRLYMVVLPALSLGGVMACYVAKITRGAMIGSLEQDFVRTARAKGLLEPAVVLKHALRNALVPIVTLSTLLFGQLLAGAVLTEQVFTIPGFGKLIVDAVFNRDYGVVQGVVLCTAIAFILMNLIADVLYIVINPRLRTA